MADLAAFFSGRAVDDDGLAQPWRQGEAGFVWYSRGAFALEALAASWTRSRAGRAPSLWLPDYFCDQATGPARQAGARLVFYPLTESLEPSWQAAERLAQGTAPDLFVLVHFFGRMADATKARAFCRRFGALLVEDAAHVMLPAPPIGAAGDFVLYSPYKTLPVPDGGLLAVRDGAALTALRRLAADDARPPPPAWPWLAKRIARKLLPGFAERRLARARAQAFADDPPPAAPAATPKLSPAARRVLGGWSAARLADAADRRKRAARALALAWRRVAGCVPLSPLDDAAPACHRLALRFADPEAASRHYARLVGRGCPAESWPDLPSEVRAEPASHAAAIRLRRSVLLLPLDGDPDERAFVRRCGPGDAG